MPPLYSATRKQASAYALPGLRRRLYFRRAEVVGTLPGFRCPTIRGAVCDFLRFVCVTKWGYEKEIFVYFPHKVIGHRGFSSRADFPP